jgi:hypothetical protein
VNQPNATRGTVLVTMALDPPPGLETVYGAARIAEYVAGIRAVGARIPSGWRVLVCEMCRDPIRGLDAPVLEALHTLSVHYDVLYVQDNDYASANKGAAEWLGIIRALALIERHEWVVKLTGRYRLLDGTIFSLIEQHPDADGVLRWFERPDGVGQYFTGLMALKASTIGSVDIDLERMVVERESIEDVLYERLDNDRIVEPDWLGVECFIAGRDLVRR